MQSFKNKKALRFVVTLGDGKFGDFDQITLEGFRANTTISNGGGLQWGFMNANIYGMRVADMDAITTYTRQLGAYKPNTVVVYAIDGDQESIVFTGNITQSWAEYAGMPDVCLNIQAQAAAIDLLKAVPPRSFKGTIDVANAMSQIAGSMGYALVNNGVAVTLENIYLPGTGMEQARELATMAGIDLFVPTDGYKRIIISPRGKPMDGTKPLVSRDTGLIGYPAYDGTTVICRTLYNPAISLLNVVKIETDVTRAAGEWLVMAVDHALDSEVPDGQWFTTFRAQNPAIFGYGTNKQ